MYQYKIENIHFNDGTIIQPGSLTIIVGPNNCGKSRILKDIKSLTSDQTANSVVVNKVEYTLPDTVEDIIEAYNIVTVTDSSNNVFLRTLSSNLVSQHNVHVGMGWEQNCQNWLKHKDDNTIKNFSYWFGSFFVSLFETEDRLKLIKETESAEVDNTTNLLQAFYKEGTEIEKTLRKIIKEAFATDIKLDYSSLRKILFRIGEDLEDAPKDPRDAIPYYDKYEKLDIQGDGIRSFIATLLAILVGKRPVLLLDEPESFLHPPQAFRLGEIIAEHAVSERQMIVSTHSSDFLRGVLSKTQEVTIMRVDRMKNTNKINMLDSKSVALISKNPLLSSTRIMDGLFYKGAIIVEADADAVFYQRVARQLDDADSFHIAHAHNKQTVAKVLYPYSSLGIRFSAIVDFDVIRVRDEFRNLLKELNMPQPVIEEALEHQSSLVSIIENVDPQKLLERQLQELEEEIQRIKLNEELNDPQTLLANLSSNLKRIRESGSIWKQFKQKGVSALDENGKIIFCKLNDICSVFGLFIVPVGELEGWLADYGLPYSTNKTKWIIKALEKIPEIEPDTTKMPWSFVQNIFTYLNKY